MNASSLDDAQLASAIVGSWELVRWQITYAATGRVTEPFGADASGLLVYAPDGYMSVLIRRSERLPGRVRGAALSEREQAQGFASYMHYAGRWRIGHGEVVHEVQHALHPDLTGTVQRRLVALNGAELLLTGDERSDAGASARTHRVLWRRAR